MSEFSINRGIGKSVEFKGLKAQYLFIFIGGLLALFVLFIIMYLVGINQWVCIGFGGIAATVLVWQTFALNAKYTPVAHTQDTLSTAAESPNYSNEERNEKYIKSYHVGEQISAALGGT